MHQTSMVFSLESRIAYLALRLFCGATMLAADASSSGSYSGAGSPANVLPFHALGTQKTGAEVARVFDAHGNSILRLAYSYLHNREDAEDILQETLIRYMSKSPEFQSATHEKAWLLRVAANLSKNRIEYNRVRDADELNEELVAEGREDLSFVWQAVRNLPTAQREAIHLHYQEGYSAAEISQLLGEKESTVRSHLKRGRDKLRETLREAYDFD